MLFVVFRRAIGGVLCPLKSDKPVFAAFPAGKQRVNRFNFGVLPCF
jgi:hypothetical protein